jgi:hypothetical protein
MPRFFSLLPTMALGLFASCATGDGAGLAGAGAGVQDPSCEGESALCDGHCVDFATDPQNCGACGRTCVVAQAEAACVAGECALGACATGWADCDGDPATGCELEIDCAEGQACATSCGSQGALSCADACAPSCTTPAESCNLADDDCDSACDEGAVAGCRIGIHRAHGPMGHFYTSNEAEAAAGGYTIEVLNYFYLYTAVAGDLRPFFRCPKPDGKRFYTTSTDCEMTAAPELTVGFIAAEPRCGSTPLHRLRNPGNNAHFYTTSDAERDNAVAMYGFISEGVAGHVWVGP